MTSCFLANLKLSRLVFWLSLCHFLLACCVCFVCHQTTKEHRPSYQ